MKLCNKCAQNKALNQFSKDKTHKDGRKNCCKDCCSAYHKQYCQSQTGKDAHNRANKKYRASHKEQRLKYARNYHNTIKGHLQRIYYCIKQRTGNPEHPNYKRYGGRGIQCKFVSSQEFVDYVLVELKIDPRNLDIDRINNDGNYEPGNIRFTTHKKNCNNR